jgi:hypothetical protein
MPRFFWSRSPQSNRQNDDVCVESYEGDVARLVSPFPDRYPLGFNSGEQDADGVVGHLEPPESP